MGVDRRLTAIVFRQPWRRLSVVSTALSTSVGGTAAVSSDSVFIGGASFGLPPIFFRQPLLSTIALRVSPELALAVAFAVAFSLDFGLPLVCCCECGTCRSVGGE